MNQTWIWVCLTSTYIGFYWKCTKAYVKYICTLKSQCQTYTHISSFLMNSNWFLIIWNKSKWTKFYYCLLGNNILLKELKFKDKNWLQS